jgi:hypothetical protein
MADEPTFSVEALKARAAIAGVTLNEEKLEDLASSMGQSLGALRTLDLRAMRMVEPAVVFKAAWSE